MERGNQMKRAASCVLVAVGAFVSCTAHADDACTILARNLKQDVLQQGTTSSQFSQLQQLVSDGYYESWNNASSSSGSFNGVLSIPEIVDFAIGDGNRSNQTNWGTRRTAFLSMTFWQTASMFRSSSRISQSSVAAISAISDCAVHLADAEGVFSQLLQVSDNRDAFVVKVWRRTAGEANWALLSLSAQPSQNSDLSCDNGWERASISHPLPLGQQWVLFNCRKNPRQPLLVAAQTTAGPAFSFAIESVDNEIQHLRTDMHAKMTQLQLHIESLSSSLNSVTTNLNKEVTDRASAVASLSASINNSLQVSKLCLLEFPGSRIDAVPVPAASTGETCQLLKEALYGNIGGINLLYGCLGPTSVSRSGGHQPPPTPNFCNW
jgi:hypothetical protein